MKNLSYHTRRWITVLAVLPAFPFLLNFLAGLHWFGHYDQGYAAVASMYVSLVFYFVAPSVSEMRHERERKRNE